MSRETDVQMLFEDLYRATQRLSLCELSDIVEQLESMPRPMRKDAQIAHKLLTHELNKTITRAEKQLAELRKRHEALPAWLKPQAQKEEL